MSTETTTALKKEHREVLTWLADRTDALMPEPGVTTSSATFADTHNVWVHWRTAKSLKRRGLIHYTTDADPEYGYGIALTDAGWAAIGRTSPRPGVSR